MPSALDLLGATGAAFGAGLVNAVAGGGTLISFPTLVALGVPAVRANVTNTVSLCPGYLGGSYAQRNDLADQAKRLRSLLGAAAAGGLVGSILLFVSSETVFRAVVPFLILAACALLAASDPLKRRLAAARGASNAAAAATAPKDGTEHRPPVALLAAVMAAAVYGGYFGAGLGIMLLAVLGLLLDESLTKLNALKQGLSLTINVVAATFFVFSGKVEWTYAAVMAVGSLVGGNVGGRVASRVHPGVLRALVIALGIAVAIKFWL